MTPRNDALPNMIEPIENSPTAPEIPPAPPVQTQNPPPAPPVPAGNPPPAAHLVVTGDVKSERELELERKLDAAERARREAEIIAAEKEDEAARLREIQSRPPEITKPNRPKRQRLGGIICTVEDDEA
jgi:hypothetical protein